MTILDDIQSFKSDTRALPRILCNSASFEVKGYAWVRCDILENELLASAVALYC